MTHRPPALLTFLGFAATAGCQGRDTLRRILAKAQAHPVPGLPLPVDANGPMMPRRHEPSLACTLRAGLAELHRRFSGHADAQIAAESGAMSAMQLRRVLGAPVIDELASKTGLSEPDLLARLARGLPVTVALMDAVGVTALPARLTAHVSAERGTPAAGRC